MTALRSTLLFLLSLWMAGATAKLAAQDAWLSTPESIQAFREQVESLNPQTSSFQLASITDRSIQLDGRSIKIRIYDPGGTAPQPVLIYVHGACWVAGSLDSHDEVSRFLAHEGHAVVVAIDYRLAPEHPYPAAHDDVFETIGWVRAHADELGVDRNRVALAGESAGAHLAAATAVRVMDEAAAEPLAFLLLVYAALDGSGSSWTECKGHYFASPEEARSRYGSPLWVDDLAGMPPTFNIYGEYESPRAEQELFVRKLREDGVAVRAYMNEGVGHDVQTWLSVTGERRAHKVAAGYVREGFGSAP